MHPGMNGTGELSFAVSTLVVTYFALPAVLEVCGSRTWSHFSVPRTPRCLVSGAVTWHSECLEKTLEPFVFEAVCDSRVLGCILSPLAGPRWALLRLCAEQRVLSGSSCSGGQEVRCEELLWPPGVGWSPCCQVERKPCGPLGALHSCQVLRVTPGRTRGPLPGAEVSLGTKAEGGAEAPLRAPQIPVVCLCVEAEPIRRPGCVLNGRHLVLQLGRAGPASLTSWPRRRLLPHLPSLESTLCAPGPGLR
ncbi:uncharacterized protein LOC133056198 [Dama dama]|uniref:uncharacterized protein LOC133056198 n=1 Tax=Dama dama TaxID=30532 RepID=UPI002A36434A|nr:uncharacterized protein LOC133056198 [Dama dama]